MNTLFSGREFPQKYLKVKLDTKGQKNSWESFTATQREEPHFSGDPSAEAQRSNGNIEKVEKRGKFWPLEIRTCSAPWKLH